MNHDKFDNNKTSLEIFDENAPLIEEDDFESIFVALSDEDKIATLLQQFKWLAKKMEYARSALDCALDQVRCATEIDWMHATYPEMENRVLFMENHVDSAIKDLEDMPYLIDNLLVLVDEMPHRKDGSRPGSGVAETNRPARAVGVFNLESKGLCLDAVCAPGV
jgi:hypothetical protein